MMRTCKAKQDLEKCVNRKNDSELKPYVKLYDIKSHPNTIPLPYRQSFYRHLKRMQASKKSETVSNSTKLCKQKAPRSNVRNNKTAKNSLFLKKNFVLKKKRKPATSSNVNRIESLDDKCDVTIQRKPANNSLILKKNFVLKKKRKPATSSNVNRIESSDNECNVTIQRKLAKNSLFLKKNFVLKKKRKPAPSSNVNRIESSDNECDVTIQRKPAKNSLFLKKNFVLKKKRKPAPSSNVNRIESSDDECDVTIQRKPANNSLILKKNFVLKKKRKPATISNVNRIESSDDECDVTIQRKPAKNSLFLKKNFVLKKKRKPTSSNVNRIESTDDECDAPIQRKPAKNSLFLKKNFVLKKKRKPTRSNVNRIESTDDECDAIIQRKENRHKWRHIIDCDESSDSTNNQVSLVIKNSTHVASTKIDPEGRNVLNKKNVTVIDYNSKTGKVPSQERSFSGAESNCSSTVDDLINETHKVKENCGLSKGSLAIIEVKNRCSMDKLFKDNIKEDEIVEDSSNISLNTPKKQVNKKGKKQGQCDSRIKPSNSNKSSIDFKSMDVLKKVPVNCITEKNLPETLNKSALLLTEQTLPKVTVKLARLSEAHRSVQENLENKSPNKNEYSDISKSVKQTDIDVDTLKYTDIVKKKKNYISTTKSINTPKISKSKLPKESNIQEDNSTLNNGELCNKVLSCKESFLTIDDTINNININDSIESANSTPHYGIQREKRSAEKDSKNVDACTKKIKLKRDFQQNNVNLHIESLNEQHTDSQNTNTSKDVKYSNDVDLCDTLEILRRSKKTSISGTKDDKNIDSIRATEISDKKYMHAVTNRKKNRRIRDKFSHDEGSTSESDEDEDENKNNSHNSLSCNTVSIFLENLANIPKETCHSQIYLNTCENINMGNRCTDDSNDKNEHNNEEDDDYISLHATETFDLGCYEENVFSNKQKVLDKKKLIEVLHSDSDSDTSGYYLSSSTFDKYKKQNEKEFNREYERYMKRNAKRSSKVLNSKSNKSDKSKIIKNTLATTCNNNNSSILPIMTQTLSKMPKIPLLSKQSLQIHNKQMEQASQTQHCPPNLTSSAVEMVQILTPYNLQSYFYGFCYTILTNNGCKRYMCSYKHNFQDFLKTFHAIEDSNKLIQIINFAKYKQFYFFCKEMYKISLVKFNIDQILTLYTMFYEIEEASNITDNVIEELLSREMPLETIVDHIVTSISSSPFAKSMTKDDIFQCIQKFIKPGKLWCIVKRMLPILTPSIHIIYGILSEYRNNINLSDMQDIKDMLLSKIPNFMVPLDSPLIETFKYFCEDSTKNDACDIESIQDLGENRAEINTIASADSKQDVYRAEPFTTYSIVSLNTSQTNEIHRSLQVQGISTSDRPYILQPIDDLPEPQSMYRNHKGLWKFFVDLERLKKGLCHEDYDYVINILEMYPKKENQSFFDRSCCNALRQEIKRFYSHVINITQRTNNKYFLVIH